MLLWTGYGPLQEGDQLWGRVFKALLQPPFFCPESRFFQLARCGSLQTWYLSNIILAHLVYRPVTNIMSDSNALHDLYVIYIAFEFDNFSPRCTFSTTRSLANQEVADAIIFHMPNFHWDGCEYHKDKEPSCGMLFWIAVIFMPVLLIPQVQNTKFKKKPSELGVHELWNRHECERKVRLYIVILTADKSSRNIQPPWHWADSWTVVRSNNK